MWLDYSLFFENFAGQVIGECNLDCQGLLDVLDFVGHVEGESVINGYYCGKPELFQPARRYVPLAEQSLVRLFVQVPELDVHGPGRLYYVTLFVERLDVDNQLFLFAVFVFVVKVSILGDLDSLEAIEIFGLGLLG